MLTAQEADIMDPEVMQDLEQQSLPLQGPVIESACALFMPEDLEDNGMNDLEHIIGSCLKDTKRNNMSYAIKSLSHLVAVSEYIKLCALYQNSNTCKRPCLNASIAIAHRMGKGPYFAYQIQHNELYLLQHCKPPPPKCYTQHGHHTLLDNEAILHDVCAYLASQDLGSVAPQTFYNHINTAILPILGINASISESTVQQWLQLKLGYQCKEATKGMYVDGHECPDVIKERESFIERICNNFEQYVGCIHVPSPTYLIFAC